MGKTRWKDTVYLRTVLHGRCTRKVSAGQPWRHLSVRSNDGHEQTQLPSFRDGFRSGLLGSTGECQSSPRTEFYAPTPTSVLRGRPLPRRHAKTTRLFKNCRQDQPTTIYLLQIRLVVGRFLRVRLELTADVPITRPKPEHLSVGLAYYSPYRLYPMRGRNYTRKTITGITLWRLLHRSLDGQT